MTESANPTLSAGEKIFKDIAWDTLVEAVLTYYGLNNWFIRDFVFLITDKLYEFLKLSVDLGAIVFMNAQHKAAYDAASIRLKVIAYDKGFDSDDYRKARDEDKKQLALYIRPCA